MIDDPDRTGHPPQSIAQAMAKVRTKRELEALFRYLGIRAQKSLGQCFLVDHNLLDFMVRAAEVGPSDLVADIGCGTGLLTAHLADAAAKVVGVEVDKRLFAICSRYLEARPNVELLRGDVLASKHALSPAFVEAVRREWATGRFAAFRVVSNLPYSVASLVVPNLLEGDLPIQRMVVTLQKEVAERLAAGKDSPAYGSLSLVVQAHARVEVLRSVPPAVFWPRPKVESAIVRLVPERGRLEQIEDYAAFAELVRSAFAYRRKTLANALAASHVLAREAPVGELLGRCVIDPAARAEQVSLEQFICLANAAAKHLAVGPRENGRRTLRSLPVQDET